MISLLRVNRIDIGAIAGKGPDINKYTLIYYTASVLFPIAITGYDSKRKFEELRDVSFYEYRFIF